MQIGYVCIIYRYNSYTFVHQCGWYFQVIIYEMNYSKIKRFVTQVCWNGPIHTHVHTKIVFVKRLISRICYLSLLHGYYTSIIIAAIIFYTAVVMRVFVHIHFFFFLISKSSTIDREIKSIKNLTNVSHELSEYSWSVLCSI